MAFAPAPLLCAVQAWVSALSIYLYSFSAQHFGFRPFFSTQSIVTRSCRARALCRRYFFN